MAGLHLGDVGLVGTILNRIFKKSFMKVWTFVMWLKIRSIAGYCKHSNEPHSLAIGGKFLNQLSGYWLLKKGSAA
jgi:hypothetical protein